MIIETFALTLIVMFIFSIILFINFDYILTPDQQTPVNYYGMYMLSVKIYKI